ncbi:bromodomain-containing protein DDB_G0270170-like [Chrysoperla carnea]|uniref:bromodomain-containing protein DDB_G0270170-like n=1 Tax=Chrysoperla carnea TaxID=189513 RepID=UPI001D0637FC|nr:bromodomain-containing protein DDB_G0270170-like [Chrysoperla carnea]
MAELTPWTEVSASWMSAWGDEDDISIKNEEFDVQNGTNNGSITFDIDSDLINASANIDKESSCSTNATFVDICHGLDLDVAHLAQDHHAISSVNNEEIEHTTIADTLPSSGIKLIGQDRILNNHQEFKVMTEQELATEYLMNSVNLMKASKHHSSPQSNENLILDDMQLDEMYSSTSNLSSTDLDQIEQKIEINTSDLMMGVDLDGHRHHNEHDLNQLISQSTQQSLKIVYIMLNMLIVMANMLKYGNVVFAHQRNDKPKYMCRLCNKEFPKRMALRNHEEYKHGIKNQQQTATTASTSATSLSGLPASGNIINTSDLILQQSKATGNTLLMNGSGGTPLLNGVGNSSANDHLGQDKMRRIHIPDIGGSIQSVPTQSSTKVRYTNGVLVDAINTEAMRQALQAQQANGTSSLPSSAPFALLRPIGGIPVLVRVLSAPHGKHMLVPATAEDLKAHGKITISDNGNGSGTGIHLTDRYDSSKNSNSTTTVQIKIPVVATVVQKFEPDGTMSMSVESPGPDNKQLIQDSINNAVDNHLNNTNNSNININDNDDNNMEFLKESCDNMSISLPNSSGYMSFHADTSTSSPYNSSITETVIKDDQDLDTRNISVVTSLKDDITNSTFDSIDLSVPVDDHIVVNSTDTSHQRSSLSNNNHHSNNYNFFNNEHHLLTTENQLRHYNNQFDSYQIIGEELAQHKTNDQHFNIQTNHNDSDIITNNNNLILNEHSLYNEVNQHFTFITNSGATNSHTNNNHHIVDDHDNDQIEKFEIL